jgi:hypothetical protein
MRLSIAIEMIDEESESDIVAPRATKNEPQQASLPFRISANFVAQLAATFLQDLDDRSGEHRETPGAIQSYEVVSAPTSYHSGTMICRKI